MFPNLLSFLVSKPKFSEVLLEQPDYVRCFYSELREGVIEFGSSFEGLDCISLFDKPGFDRKLKAFCIGYPYENETATLYYSPEEDNVFLYEEIPGYDALYEIVGEGLESFLKKLEKKEER